jgi:hypothetical protein
MKISDNFFKKTLSIPVLRFFVANLFPHQYFRYMTEIVDSGISQDEKLKLIKEAINSGVNEVTSWRNIDKPRDIHQLIFHQFTARENPSLFKTIALESKKRVIYVLNLFRIGMISIKMNL